MTYQITGDTLFFVINRPAIIDISANDILEVKGFPGARYTWTDQDSEFMENNPDDEIMLQIDKIDDNRYKAAGIILKYTADEGH